LRKSWSKYVLLFEKVGSSVGDKVFITGFHRRVLTDEQDHPPAHLTVQALQEMAVEDGGPVHPFVLLDVKEKGHGEGQAAG
jgi:hypothetical protein